GSGQGCRPGLLSIHCAHRGADLSYGRLEDGGLRCIYHGWLYDLTGRCLEQPGEPSPPPQPSPARGEGADSSPLAEGAARPFRERVRQLAYPCVEKNGIIFAYLGPGEPPLLPAYAFLSVPEDHVYPVKLYSQCNFLQGNEG